MVVVTRSRRLVVAAVALADPTVDVVAVLLPVTRLHLGGELDRVEPLARLLAPSTPPLPGGGAGWCRATCTTCSRTSARRTAAPVPRACSTARCLPART